MAIYTIQKAAFEQPFSILFLSKRATTGCTRFATLSFEMTVRIVIIGQGVFRDGLASLLADDAEVVLVGAADTWQEARAIFATQKSDVLIVDHKTPQLSKEDLEPLLQSEGSSLKVIFLTLADNHMVIHNWQRISNVTVTDLRSAVNAASPVQRGSEA